MTGYDLQRVKQIERENGRLKDVISELRRDIDRLMRDPDKVRHQAMTEGARYTPEPKVERPASKPPVAAAVSNGRGTELQQVPGMPIMTSTELRIYYALANASPNLLSLFYLIENCTGGRIVSENAMRASLMRLRNKLKSSGWEIICYHGTGYSLRSSR